MVRQALKHAPYAFAALTLVVLPFLYCNAAFDQSYAVKGVFLGGVLAVWALVERRTPLPPAFKNYLLLYGALVVWSFASLIWAHDLGEGLKAALRTAASWSFLYLTGRLFVRYPVFREKLLHLIAAAAVLMAIIAVGQWTGWGFRQIDGWRGFYPWATLHNPNMLASYLFLSLPAVAYVAFRRKNLRWFGVATIVLILFVLILTCCRTMIFCIGGGVLAVTIAAWAQHAAPLRRYLIIGGLLGSVVLIALTPRVLDAVRDSYRAPLDQRSLHQRLAMWSVSCKMLLAYPLTGVGAGQWNIEADGFGMKHTLPRVAHVAFIRPHNDFLWRGAELGFVGLWLYGAVLLWPVAAAWRRPAAKFALFALAGYLADAAFNFPSERPEAFTLHHFWVAAAFLGHDNFEDIVGAQHTCVAAPLRAASIPLKAIMIILSLAFAYICNIQLQSEIAFTRALTAHDRHDWPRMAAEARRADNFLNRLAPTGWPVAYYEGVALVEMGRPAEAEAAFRRSAVVHPNHAATWRKLGERCAARRDTAEAAACFKKAWDLCPACGENM